MTDPRGPGSSRPAAEAPPGTPRWVKTLAVMIVVVAVLVVIGMVLIGGEHGPGRHL